MMMSRSLPSLLPFPFLFWVLFLVSTTNLSSASTISACLLGSDVKEDGHDDDEATTLVIEAELGDAEKVQAITDIMNTNENIALSNESTATMKSTTTTATTTTTTADHGKKLVDWLRSKEGGLFNPKLEIRQADPTDPDSFYGMFANEEIEEDDILLQIPREWIFTSVGESSEEGVVNDDDDERNPDDDDDWADDERSPDDDDDWICPVTRKLIREMKLGDSSRYAPYVNYLKDQPRGQLPSHWSRQGKALLLKVLGEDDQDSYHELLPPGFVVGLVDGWKANCDGGDDEFEQHVFLMVLQRGWDEILIPVFDMMSHRNGDQWLNTKSNSIFEETLPYIQVRARKHIRAGGEIYTSYDQCEECGGRMDTYGTQDIFRDYGFVENFPQKWIFENQNVAFRLDQKQQQMKKQQDGGEKELEQLELTWITPIPQEKEILEFFEQQIERLQYLHIENLHEIPVNELATIRNFIKATMTAMKTMMGAAAVVVAADNEALAEK
mmetsp:Transcript_9911/g.13076  ORF Transcript_9911/g.13076 Transcript_9911/m.13076 type:complete len:497 (-) Transcript_9911:357-1847(-)